MRGGSGNDIFEFFGSRMDTDGEIEDFTNG